MPRRGERETLVLPPRPAPPVLALLGQEERPCADIDVLVGAGQAPAVLLQVVPGILVEVGHLVGEGGSETGWDLSCQRGCPEPSGAGTATKPQIPAGRRQACRENWFTEWKSLL